MRGSSTRRLLWLTPGLMLLMGGLWVPVPAGAVGGAAADVGALGGAVAGSQPSGQADPRPLASPYPEFGAVDSGNKQNLTYVHPDGSARHTWPQDTAPCVHSTFSRRLGPGPYVGVPVMLDIHGLDGETETSAVFRRQDGGLDQWSWPASDDLTVAGGTASTTVRSWPVRGVLHDPAAITTYGDQHLYFVGVEGELRYSWWDAQVAQFKPESGAAQVIYRGMPLTGRPVVVAGDGHRVVVARTVDGRLLIVRQDDKDAKVSAELWNPKEPAMAVGSDPVAGYFAGELRVWYLNPDGFLNHLRWSGHRAERQPETLRAAGGFVGRPALGKVKDEPFVFARSTKGTLFYVRYPLSGKPVEYEVAVKGGKRAGFTPELRIAGNPVVVRQSGYLHVFAARNDQVSALLRVNAKQTPDATDGFVDLLHGTPGPDRHPKIP